MSDYHTFKPGDKVVCVVDSNAFGNLRIGETYTVTGLCSGLNEVFLDGGTISWRSNRFRLADEPAPVKDDVNPVDALISKYATELDDAIAEGTMVPRLSAIGILAQFLIDYKAL
jgi:hypothetical protein